MIRTISGQVRAISEHSLIIEVFGLGIEVHAPTQDINTCGEGDEILLHTHLALRENAVDLYGFKDARTLYFFELLLGVSGVGPRSALGITNLANIETLSDAIRARDISYLTRVAGIGKKMAEKIILELKDKVGDGPDHLQESDGEILDTLIALGYKEREAKKALQAVPNTIEGKEDRLKAALKQS